MQGYNACDLVRRSKVLIAGGFGVGKTTFVGAVSEIRPVSTEERLTAAGEPLDSLNGVEAKTTTTVAIDFGRRTFPGPPDVKLLLFGTPGQPRFQLLWEDLSFGADGAVVLVDTRRLEDCFEAVDFFERRQVPFLIAVNQFHGTARYEMRQVREALRLPAEVPVVRCDARDRHSAVDVLIHLIGHALNSSTPSVNIPLGARP
ncbi:GTP-binding protein [Streptomyces sp. NPDC020883]|uniref:GTP-binding protein n=1 Tax=Streptomyces sp. NPDC020883 TaxID=3365099 RepID=UPI0037884916